MLSMESIPSRAYPSAQPQVSTLTNCNSILLMTASQCSTHSSPVNGSVILHKVESKRPLILNLGILDFFKRKKTFSI